jgi:hypothetical protein
MIASTIRILWMISNFGKSPKASQNRLQVNVIPISLAFNPTHKQMSSPIYLKLINQSQKSSYHQQFIEFSFQSYKLITIQGTI